MATVSEHLAAGTLPAHVQARHFDEDAEVPTWMAGDSNWSNHPLLLDEPIFVRFNGETRPCTNRIHLSRWLAEGGVIVSPPREASANLTPLGTHLAASQEG
jgi:hypothetical protein